MREVSRLWHTLETVPVLAGIEAEWAARLAEDLEVARPFLHPESDLSSTYPCPYGGGEACPRQVIPQGEDDFAAVCNNDEPPDCDTVYLKREDVLVRRFDTGTFARWLASLFGFENASGKAQGGHRGILDLGTLSVAPGRRLSALLVLHLRTESGRQAVDRLLARIPSKELILAVPGAEPDLELRRLLEARGYPVIACRDFVAANPDGTLAPKAGQAEILAALRGAATYGSTPLDPLVLRESGATYGDQVIAFTHEAPGGRPVTTAKGYDALLAERDSFDIFVDGQTMAIRRRLLTGEAVEGRLTRGELDLLSRYLDRHSRGQGPSAPGRLIDATSTEAAMQVFKRMRRAVDIPVGTRSFRLFKRPPGCQKGEYSFSPDPNLSYCILIPKQQ